MPCPVNDILFVMEQMFGTYNILHFVIHASPLFSTILFNAQLTTIFEYLQMLAT